MAQRQRIFYKPELKAERRYARKHLSPAESALWQAMRCGRAGVRCRRKASIGEHIVDFYIAGQKLAVDIVKIGDDVVARHAKAQSLKQHKVDLLCLQQEEVLVNTAGVVRKISDRAGCL